MGRGKVEMERIENRVSRQVTFSERRKVLLKKAHELAVLCDVDVGVIVFSERGRLFEYPNPPASLTDLIRRYEEVTNTQLLQETHCTDHQQMIAEIGRLRLECEQLEASLRMYTGEDLSSFASMDELDELEQQLESALSKVRARKMLPPPPSFADLNVKEKSAASTMLQLWPQTDYDDRRGTAQLPNQSTRRRSRGCLPILVVATLAALSVQLAAAADYPVGGSGSWDASGTSYDSWSAKQTFKQGDTISFKFAPSYDVTEVTRAGYESCSGANPVKSYSGGRATVKLIAPGKRYFLCSVTRHCAAGMKLEVTVAAAAVTAPAPAKSKPHHQRSVAPTPAPASTDELPNVSTPNAAPAPKSLDAASVVDMLGGKVVVGLGTAPTPAPATQPQVCITN